MCRYCVLRKQRQWASYFTYNTGGVPNYVENGKNGYMLPIGSSGQEFGKKSTNVSNQANLKKCRQLLLMSTIRN